MVEDGDSEHRGGAFASRSEAERWTGNGSEFAAEKCTSRFGGFFEILEVAHTDLHHPGLHVRDSR